MAPARDFGPVGVVTHMTTPGEELISWHRERCGLSEAAPDEPRRRGAPDPDHHPRRLPRGSQPRHCGRSVSAPAGTAGRARTRTRGRWILGLAWS